MFRKRIGYRFEDSEVVYIYFKVMMRLLMGFSHFLFLTQNTIYLRSESQVR